MCWILSIKFHIIGKPMCLPFQWHLIHYNWLLSSEDTTFWIWLGHRPNVPTFNILSQKSMEWKWWSSHCDDRTYFQFKCWLSHIDDAVGGLNHMQLTQIGYHFKATHLSFLMMINQTESLKYRRLESSFSTCWEVELAGIVSNWICFILAHLICDPPLFTVPYLHSIKIL